MTDWYPLSSAQEHVVRLHAADPTRLLQSTVRSFSVSGVDPDRLQRAVDALVQRHEPLRTVYGDGQRILSAMDIPVRSAEFTPEPFDLTTGPLLRLSLSDNRLVVHAHLLVADAWSWQVLCDDLSAAYRGVELPELDRQYVDWALWHRDQPIAHLHSWWSQRLSGAPITLPIPAPGTRGPGEACRPIRLNPGPRTNSVVLATALARALGRRTGQSRLTIGLATANRSRPEAHLMLGFFVHSVPLVVDLTAADLTAYVSAAITAAHDHNGIAFPPSQVNFVYHPHGALGQLHLDSPALEHHVPAPAKFPLTIRADDAFVRAEYAVDSVDAAWVDTLLDDLVEELP
ncbi:condensation domain-containing protein [Kutzneria sp. NPDC052558]|uniref:condensation domain-containing protein n=1 Tax=Kutzneria sp. NPDC052558 TaxID=3364121 RepID=UPI0037CA5A46